MTPKGNEYRRGYELGLKAGYAKAREEEKYWRERYEMALKWLDSHNFSWVAEHMREAIEEKIEVAEIETAYSAPEEEKDEPLTAADGRELEIDEVTLYGLMGWL